MSSVDESISFKILTIRHFPNPVTFFIYVRSSSW